MKSAKAYYKTPTKKWDGAKFLDPSSRCIFCSIQGKC